MTSDPHAQALATLRKFVAAVEQGADPYRDLPTARDALAILERPQALEGEVEKTLRTIEAQGMHWAARPLRTHISDLQRRLGEAERDRASVWSQLQQAGRRNEHQAADLDEATAALASAREENGKLREALAPFVKQHERCTMYREWADLDASTDIQIRVGDDDNWTAWRGLTVGAFRRAVLASTASPETDSAPVAVAPPPAGGVE